MGYETPEIDDSVPAFDPADAKRGRWDRRMTDGVHEATLVKSEIGFRQDKGEHRLMLSFLVEGQSQAECPEGPVRADLEAQLPPVQDFKFRNFLEKLLPGQKKCSDVQVAALTGARVKILTRYSPAKGQFKAKNWVEKIVEVVNSKDVSGVKTQSAEPDPFDAPATT